MKGVCSSRELEMERSKGLYALHIFHLESIQSHSILKKDLMSTIVSKMCTPRTCFMEICLLNTAAAQM